MLIAVFFRDIRISLYVAFSQFLWGSYFPHKVSSFLTQGIECIADINQGNLQSSVATWLIMEYYSDATQYSQ